MDSVNQAVEDSVEPEVSETVKCIACTQSIPADSKFCSYCRANQTAPAVAQSTPEPHTNVAQLDLSPTAELILRASSNIWDRTELEVTPKPGKPRALLIVDEQTVHLSHTDRRITATELLERVQKIIRVNEVPVVATLRETRWQSDNTEVRPRIVASLVDHLYSDVKMILGVDYMGRWASIKMNLAVEPPTLPVPPPPPQKPNYPQQPTRNIAPWVLAMMILGILLIIVPIAISSKYDVQRNFPLFIPVGLGLVIAGAIANNSHSESFLEAHRKQVSKMKADYERQVAEHKVQAEKARTTVEAEAQEKSLYRTYKIEDMRLFSSAMKVIFQAVIDDIVTNEGGQVERIEGGKGGYLNEDGVSQLAPAPRQENAAQDFEL